MNLEESPAGSQGPFGLAVDGAGNAYTSYAPGPSRIPPASSLDEWRLTNNATPEFGFSGFIFNLAVDGAGNVYIADPYNDEIDEWTPTNTVVTLVSSGLNGPQGVAVDGAGNVYIADTGDNAIKEWTAANSNVTTLVASELNGPQGLAVDSTGNVYIADSANGAIKEWLAGNGNVITLVTTDYENPKSVAVDGAGNVYFVGDFIGLISEWVAADTNLILTTLPGVPEAVAVDPAGNLFLAGISNSLIAEWPYAFVDPTPKLEGLAGGNDALPAVVPATEDLLPPFTPTSDQTWLTITGVTNGVVSFSFAANTGPARTANITLLGQTMPITQGVIGTPPNLTGARMPSNGVLQFVFTNTPGGAFTVLSTTNLSLPLSNWTVAGTPSNTAPGVFQFTSPPTTNDAQLFYSIRSP